MRFAITIHKTLTNIRGIVVSFFTGGAFCGAGLAGPVSTSFKLIKKTYG
jgi:hypothetical protein